MRFDEAYVEKLQTRIEELEKYETAFSIATKDLRHQLYIAEELLRSLQRFHYYDQIQQYFNEQKEKI